MQQLMNKLSEHAYIDVHRSCPDTYTIKNILWSHLASIELLHAFSCVLIMDYVTPRFPKYIIAGTRVGDAFTHGKYPAYTH